MGPCILLDKSALEALSFQEISFLQKHYYVNIPPVLIIEILADLKKFDDAERSKERVAHVASKIPSFDSMVNGHYRQLTLGTMLGERLTMDGRPVILGAEDFIDDDGELCTFLDEQPERESLRRWREGVFSGTEELLAEQWRESTKALDLEGFRQRFEVDIESIESNGSLSDEMYSMLCAPDEQRNYLEWFLEQLTINPDHKAKVLKRWDDENHQSVAYFSAYAFHCIKVNFIFQLAVLDGYIGTRSTNRVDMEYLLYLPFCKVFASGDKDQSKLARLFMSSEQDFVSAGDLKTDLSRIIEHWEGMSEAQQKCWSTDYGNHPPQKDTLFTHRVWKKHMKPWKPRSGNLVNEMSQEAKDNILEMLKKKMGAYNRQKKRGQSA